VETIHLWTQVVGKIRMECSPWINHSWGVVLRPTARGLTTGALPWGGSAFEIDLDLVEHRLAVRTDDGRDRTLVLEPRSVADFHRSLLGVLKELGIDIVIDTLPNEIEDPIPFPEDDVHASYDPDHARALAASLRHATRVCESFRARYLGKCSPVHFFWGSFDLAVTRFSGRTAPEHPGGIPHLPDVITREAYSHEVSSAGFWPGRRDGPGPLFYSYAYPTPEGFAEAEVQPPEARWLGDMGEFALAWEDARASDAPDDAVHAFLQSTWEAAAELGEWEREGWERPRGWRPLPRAGERE
jgi:hypothetical protein